MTTVEHTHSKVGHEYTKMKLNESALRLAIAEIGQSLRVRDMVGKALTAKGQQDPSLISSKVALVDAVLECTDGHLSSNLEHSAAHFLRAKKSYNESMSSLEDVTCVSETTKTGLRKHLEAHKSIVDDKLSGIEKSVIEKVARELAVNDNNHSYASKYFLAYTIIAKKAQGWKWLILGGTAYAAAAASFGAGALFEHLNGTFDGLGGLLVGGGSHALLKTKKVWQQAKLLTEIFIDKYSRRHLKKAIEEVHTDRIVSEQTSAKAT
ncbi:MAG: hypothetical protein KGH94_04210 [Candidatus Micrarchaeota archaeon]|nr:hypothetical protein [Candidatus Micrarchaeota archaeon]